MSVPPHGFDVLAVAAHAMHTLQSAQTVVKAAFGGGRRNVFFTLADPRVCFVARPGSRRHQFPRGQLAADALREERDLLFVSANFAIT